MDLSAIRAALGDIVATDAPDDRVLALCAETITSTRQKLADQIEASSILAAEANAAEADCEVENIGFDPRSRSRRASSI